MMTYKQTLDYLYSQLPMFTRIGASAFKKDLTNTLALCAALDNPHLKFPTIHIAGTNGKGSTAHLTAAILQAAGYKVGLYVSPHYKDFRERIKINGTYISKKYVKDFVKQNIIHFEKIQPSFFEMTVAMAFDYFYTEGVDIAVIEVGLGGRFDSTNIITPLVSVITNISYDHTDMLGETLPEIAFEKAGIIKQNVSVVIGEYNAETLPVFEKKATEMDAPIYFAAQDIEIQTVSSDFDKTVFNVTANLFFESSANKFADTRVTVGLSGDFQEKNVATVLETVSILNKYTPFKINETALFEGLKNVKSLVNFIGRWQVIATNPIILCDSAHNEGGLKWVTQQLKTLAFNKLHIVVGFVKDKDLSKVLTLFPKDAVYYFAKANIPRGLDAEILRGLANEQSLKGKAYKSVKQALAAAKKSAKPDDLIYVGGSIFVVSEVL